MHNLLLSGHKIRTRCITAVPKCQSSTGQRNTDARLAHGTFTPMKPHVRPKRHHCYDTLMTICAALTDCLGSNLQTTLGHTSFPLTHGPTYQYCASLHGPHTPVHIYLYFLTLFQWEYGAIGNGSDRMRQNSRLQRLFTGWPVVF